MSRRYKTKAAERLYHSTDCPPSTPDFTWPRCLPSAPPTTGVGAYTSEQALLAALFMPRSLAPWARIRFLLLMMCHAALPSPCCGTICRLFVRLCRHAAFSLA